MSQHILNPQAKITLGYWGIRGLAQPIRFLLTCAEVPFSELRLGVFQNGTLMKKEEEEKDWKQVRSRHRAIPFSGTLPGALIFTETLNLNNQKSIYYRMRPTIFAMRSSKQPIPSVKNTTMYMITLQIIRYLVICIVLNNILRTKKIKRSLLATVCHWWILCFTNYCGR